MQGAIIAPQGILITRVENGGVAAAAGIGGPVEGTAGRWKTWGDCGKAELLARECPYTLCFLPVLPVPHLFFLVVPLPIHPLPNHLSKKKAEQTENEQLFLDPSEHGRHWANCHPEPWRDTRTQSITTLPGHKSTARASTRGNTSTVSGTLLEAQWGELESAEFREEF